MLSAERQSPLPRESRALPLVGPMPYTLACVSRWMPTFIFIHGPDYDQLPAPNPLLHTVMGLATTP